MAHQTGTYVPPNKTHSEETKIRLTPGDDALLRAIAQKSDMPPAVLARMLVVRGLSAVGAMASPLNAEGDAKHG